ncbi:thioredoxin reductase (NADPH) [Asanoa hainanensis]|uniref:Thioredoxin reductase (NADPH) n=1 Tax=Asanoa hainanensis TaxID=560556 RepID=A0A239N2T4_9ACTN|nr:FAD-dependent oxidoreductase [Asanoa hainanensis]SNT48479.1 thioredoxin reductase (NADPH) [Asanoa hainanensis]
MTLPVLVAVDDDLAALLDLERELRDRYERHYRVVALPSADEAYARLEELAVSGEEIALVLSGQRLSSTTGIPVLEAARRLHPQAKRGLVIAWGDWGKPSIGKLIFESMARGLIDHYLLRPSAPPDEAFHQEVSALLLGWAEARRTLPYMVHIVGESWSGRAYELRKALVSCALPHSFCLADSDEGRVLLEGRGDQLPVVIFPNGKALTNPSNAEIALAAGSAVNPARIDYDLLIVGAGPAGLSAAVYGASEGFSTLVVDEGGVGGQATSSSMIRNYLGFPRGVSGRRLAQRAYDQAWIFGANFAFMQVATNLRRDGDRLAVTLSDSGDVHARAVLLTMGATYRRIGVAELEALNGAGVFYGGPTSEAPAMAGRDVFVLGGANSAGQAAIYLSRYAKTVTLVVRADSLTAGMSHYLVREVEATPNVSVRLRTEVVGGGGDGALDHLVLRDNAKGTQETVEAAGLFLMIGAKPSTDWLPPEIERDDRGFVRTGQNVTDAHPWPLNRTRMFLETSMPAVFAAGDIRHGSVKRVASAVGEGSVAIQLLHDLFAEEHRQPGGRPKGRSA